MEKLALEGGRPVRSKPLVFGSPDVREEEIKEVVDTLRSGWLSTGPKVKKFEEVFRNYVGSKYAVALNSCTAALELALIVAGVTRGDEVITSPMTFAATANAIVHREAKPVFVDIQKDTMNIDPAKIEEKLSGRTKAILPVHLAGRPCDMKKILSIAGRNSLTVIEDAAHAVGAEYDGRKVGSIGDLTCFSFYVTKNIVTGEGGMLTTDNGGWASEAEKIGNHGLSKSAWGRFGRREFGLYDVVYPGYKFNMMDIQAALGLHQMARIEENLRTREKIFRKYNKAFKDVPEVATPVEGKNIRHARHLYTILVDLDMLKCDRNQFMEAIKAENVGVGLHFISLHLTSYYGRTFGFRRGEFPNAEYVSDRTISLPLSSKLSEEDTDDVVEAVKKVADYYAK